MWYRYDLKSEWLLNSDKPEPDRKIKGNRTRIKSDLSGFLRILNKKERFEICVNPFNLRHPRSIEVCSQIIKTPVVIEYVLRAED